MQKHKLVIIIVTFNSEKYIGECIHSIIESKISKSNYTILVVDNHSKDNTVVKVKSYAKKFQNILIIENKCNVGFAKAVNAGVRYLESSEYFLLLNPDTICDSTTIKELLNCAKKNKAGIVGGNTFDNKGVQSGSYFRLPNLMVGIFDFTNLRKAFPSDYWHKYFYYQNSDLSKLSDFPVEVVTGGFMLIAKETIDKIGLLDERYFMYLEDVDYCLRAREQRIKIVHSNKSKIIHFSGRSSNNRDRIRHTSWMWSRKMYYLKNFGLLPNMLLQPIFLLDDLYILGKMFIKK